MSWPEGVLRDEGQTTWAISAAGGARAALGRPSRSRLDSSPPKLDRLCVHMRAGGDAQFEHAGAAHECGAAPRRLEREYGAALRVQPRDLRTTTRRPLRRVAVAVAGATP